MQSNGKPTKKEAQPDIEPKETKEENAPDETPKSPFEKARALKDSVVQKTSELREKAEPTLLVVDSLRLASDVETESLRQDFEKAQLKIVEVGNHLE